MTIEHVTFQCIWKEVIIFKKNVFEEQKYTYTRIYKHRMCE